MSSLRLYRTCRRRRPHDRQRGGRPARGPGAPPPPMRRDSSALSPGARKDRVASTPPKRQRAPAARLAALRAPPPTRLRARPRRRVLGAPANSLAHRTCSAGSRRAPAPCDARPSACLVELGGALERLLAVGLRHELPDARLGLLLHLRSAATARMVCKDHRRQHAPPTNGRPHAPGRRLRRGRPQAPAGAAPPPARRGPRSPAAGRSGWPPPAAPRPAPGHTCQQRVMQQRWSPLAADATPARLTRSAASSSWRRSAACSAPRSCSRSCTAATASCSSAACDANRWVRCGRVSGGKASNPARPTGPGRAPAGARAATAPWPALARARQPARRRAAASASVSVPHQVSAQRKHVLRDHGPPTRSFPMPTLRSDRTPSWVQNSARACASRCVASWCRARSCVQTCERRPSRDPCCACGTSAVPHHSKHLTSASWWCSSCTSAARAAASAAACALACCSAARRPRSASRSSLAACTRNRALPSLPGPKARCG